MSFQVPDYIRTLTPYVPGKPIEETQREFKIKEVIKLASNENPLGASPKAKRAIATALSELSRYPDASGYRLKEALKAHLPSLPHLRGTSFFLGNGSNEIIDYLIRTYCVAGDAIVTSQAAFIAYKISAQIHGVRTLEAPLDQDLKFNIQELADLVRKDQKVRLVFIANPNNPTGTYLTQSELKALMTELSQIRGGSVILVLDAAYQEYVTAQDLPDPWMVMKDYPNTVVLRTFSKIYGLAGLRVGYALSSAEIISHLEKVRQPFNLNALALAGAEAALKDRNFIERAKRLNTKEMKAWEKHLGRLGIPFWKSQGNFILIDCKAGLGKTGAEMNQACLTRGVILRPISNYGFPNYLRITIGTPKENKKAIQVITQIQAQSKLHLRA